MSKKIFFTAVAAALLVLGCKSPSDNDNADISTIQFQYAGHSFVLTGGTAVVSKGSIRISNFKSLDTLTKITITVKNDQAGTYNLDSVDIMFDNDTNNYAAISSLVSHGAEINLTLTEVLPDLKGNFTATVIRSQDPDYTASEVTGGMIDIKEEDILCL